MKFYTSDTHFYHGNIIKLSNRPFRDIEHMNFQIIENWNMRVKSNDEVYILGDFAFCDGKQANELLRKLNGIKHLIVGNHDYFLRDREFDKKLFASIRDYMKIHDGDKKVILCHYPIAVWDCQYHGAIHLYGHIHNNATTRHPLCMELVNAYNVGVDTNNFTPNTLDELINKGEN